MTLRSRRQTKTAEGFASRSTESVLRPLSPLKQLCSSPSPGMLSPPAPGELRLKGRCVCVSWGKEEEEEEVVEVVKGSTEQAP